MKKTILTLLAIAGISVGAGTSAFAALTWDFGPSGAFTGTGPNSSTWLQATLTQGSDADSVNVGLNWVTVPTGTKVLELYMNFATDPSSLTVSGIDPSWFQKGEDAFKADGDGKYDLLFANPAHGGSILTSPGSLSFTIHGTGITPASFDYNSTSAPGNGTTWPIAAHLGGYNNSVFVGGVPRHDTPVPEPATVLAGALLLLPLGASTIRVMRKRA